MFGPKEAALGGELRARQRALDLLNPTLNPESLTWVWENPGSEEEEGDPDTLRMLLHSSRRLSDDDELWVWQRAQEISGQSPELATALCEAINYNGNCWRDPS